MCLLSLLNEQLFSFKNTFRLLFNLFHLIDRFKSVFSAFRLLDSTLDELLSVFVLYLQNVDDNGTHLNE